MTPLRPRRRARLFARVATGSCLTALAIAFVSAAPADMPKITRLTPALDRLLAKDASLEKLTDGYKWVEGPVWSRAGSFLLFSDIPNNVIQRWKAGEGVSVFEKPSGYSGSTPFTGPEPGSNGLTFDREGRLVLCQHGDRRVARREASGTFTTLADRFEGKRLNSPNDLVFHSSGALYFTDPPYGLPGRWQDPGKELDFQGVYRLGTDGKLTLLNKELRAPNGLAFSPDEKTLYVAQSDPERAIWMAYPVKADGTLGDGRVFYDATPAAKQKLPGLPDGLKVDEAGNLWATGPGGVLILSPQGAHVGTIETGVPTANCAWGDDGSTLYITANTAVWRVRTMTKGRVP
jgi:gluconolactonase